ncbi:MAG: hypothetical protein LWY06_05420 [Firmicutes bacterium]|nr:hypothetical protein [Bacillota bacterium]
MKYFRLAVFAFIVLSLAITAWAGPLDNPTGALQPAAKVDLVYNNQVESGYVIMCNSEPFVLIDSLKNLFDFADFYNSNSGSYMVNNKAVDKYYYNGNLYLNLSDFCTAVNLKPKYDSGKNQILFLSGKTLDEIKAPKNALIKVKIYNLTKGDNQDPNNNKSYMYSVGLTNKTGGMISLNHFNFILVGQSGKKYVSVKNWTYDVVYGNNDTPDALSLDPGVEHKVGLTFNLPGDDTPAKFFIYQNQKAIGYSDASN